jgi:hypothetical protein
VNRITAWLRVRDRARFSRDIREAARAIGKLGREARQANRDSGGFGAALGKLGDILKTKKLSGRTRIFGFAIGTVATAAVAAIPVIVGLGGALVALTGSLAAATVGAGLLAVSLGGVLGLALGAVGLAGLNVAKNFAAVNTRFQTWRATVKAFGADSQQAQTALKRLMGIVATNGGPVVLRAVQAWQDLRDAFEQAMAPLTQDMIQGMTQLFGVIKSILPTIALFTRLVFGALKGVVAGWLQFFTSGTFLNGLISVGEAFKVLAGPLGQGFLNIFTGLWSIMIRMLPLLTPIVQGFERITGAFAQWARGANLSPFIAQLRSWWGLLKATGGLLVTILGGGAAAGKSLVDSLTKVLNGWNAFLKTTRGNSQMTAFFADAVSMTKAFAKFMAGLVNVLFKFGRAALPFFTKVFNGIVDGVNMFLDAIKPIGPFWHNVLGPFLLGLAKGVGGNLLGAFKVGIFIIKVFATILGAVGTKLGFLRGTFEFLGKAVGFFFGGAILKLLSRLGELSILLKPLGFLFHVLGIPIRIVAALMARVVGWGSALGRFFLNLASRFIPQAVAALRTLPGFLASLFPKFFQAGKKLWFRLKAGLLSAIGSGLGFAGDIAKGVANAVIGLLNSAIPNKLPIPGAPDIDLPDNPIPKLASGGVVSGTGSWITGEAGPELNTLRNGRVFVQPLPAIAAPGPGVSTMEPGSGHRVFVSKVYLKNRQIAEAVHDEAENDRARR